MRDKIAEILENMPEDMNGWEDAADEIIAALPGMVPELVWEGVEDDCFSTCEALGFSYEICVFDTLERSCDYSWQATAKPDNMQRWSNATTLPAPSQASFSEAKAAANAHHAAQVMAAFGVVL
jgi:hypothetical protein